LTCGANSKPSDLQYEAMRLMLFSRALSRRIITGNWKSEVNKFGFVDRKSAMLEPWAAIGIPLWKIDIESS
jgi:hypothetical protein